MCHTNATIVGGAPANAGPSSPAMDLFNRGEAALRAGDVAGAMEYYRQASKFRSQLDPMTAQRLQEKMGNANPRSLYSWREPGVVATAADLRHERKCSASADG